MDISVVTNQIANNWHPDDLARFLGANEETLVLWGAAMKRAGHGVTIYTSLRGTEFIDAAGVWWRKLEAFNPASYSDVLISFKTKSPWLFPTNTGTRIHWSNDVESAWSSGLVRQIDKFVLLGTYHVSRMPWVPEDRRVSIPLAIDPAIYKPGGEKDPLLSVYATSPDRGLDTLLMDWPRIQIAHPGLKLIVTYDWSRTAPEFRRYMEPLLAQDGVSRETPDSEGMLRIFQRAKYYFNLLNNPDSDLFGFGPTKAALCGAIPILPSVSANGFSDTVEYYIPYAEFLRGFVTEFANSVFCIRARGWDEVVAEFWNPLLAGPA